MGFLRFSEVVKLKRCDMIKNKLFYLYLLKIVRQRSTEKEVGSLNSCPIELVSQYF